MSHRAFVDRFRRQIGVAPKMAGRIVRFERANRMITGGGNLARIAAQAGCADQAYLTREVAYFAGCTPAQLRRADPAG